MIDKERYEFEKCLKYEKDLKEEYIRKADEMEKRYSET